MTKTSLLTLIRGALIPTALLFMLTACIQATPTPTTAPTAEPIAEATPEPAAEETAEPAAQDAAPSPFELAGTAWRLDYLGEPETGQAALDGVNSTLNFSLRNYYGSGGCNWFQGVYSATPPSLRLRPPTQTRLTCSTPAGVMEQEGIYTAILIESGEYRLEDEKLVLYRAGTDQPLATFSPTEDAPFEGTQWGVQLINNGSSWFEVIITSEITATFADGQLTGNAGCNDYSAAYVLDGDAITITDVAATEKACDSPVGVMDQETVFLNTLPMAAGYEVSGGALVLNDAEGSALLYLGVR